MSRKQWLQKIRQILLRRRDALRRSLAGELRRFNTWEEPVVGDEADGALDTDYGAVNSQLAQAESRELKAIEEALQRLQSGEYGICDECGRNIPMSRLQALPYATNCVACQRSSESQRIGEAAGGDWSRLEDPSDRAEDLTLDSLEFVS
jgi:DnaK suppressor protein